MLISDNVISGPEGAAPPPPATPPPSNALLRPPGRMINLLALKADFRLKWVALNSAKCYNNMLLFLVLLLFFISLVHLRQTMALKLKMKFHFMTLTNLQST